MDTSQIILGNTPVGENWTTHWWLLSWRLTQQCWLHPGEEDWSNDRKWKWHVKDCLLREVGGRKGRRKKEENSRFHHPCRQVRFKEFVSRSVWKGNIAASVANVTLALHFFFYFFISMVWSTDKDIENSHIASMMSIYWKILSTQKIIIIHTKKINKTSKTQLSLSI